MEIYIRSVQNGWVMEKRTGPADNSETYIFTSANKLVQQLMLEVYDDEARLQTKTSERIQSQHGNQKAPVGPSSLSEQSPIPNPQSFDQYDPRRDAARSAVESNRKVGPIPGALPENPGEGGKSGSKL